MYLELVYDIATASMSVVIEEQQLFRQLTEKILIYSEYFKKLAHTIAVIDLSAGSAFESSSY